MLEDSKCSDEINQSSTILWGNKTHLITPYHMQIWIQDCVNTQGSYTVYWYEVRVMLIYPFFGTCTDIDLYMWYFYSNPILLSVYLTLSKLRPMSGYYLPTTPLQAGCDTKSIFTWSNMSLNSEFSFS